MNQDSGWRKRQIALDKKAENARELGLDYEPRKTIQEMAREAQLPYFYQTGDVANLKQLKAFAELVRADEREQIAQMIEDAPPLVKFAQNDQGGCMMCGFTPKLAAKTIRARSNT